MAQISRLAAATVLAAVILTVPALWAAGDAPVVNINTAGVEKLILLPRIGPTVARRIVEFREKNGRFQRTEDLLLVQGVGEKTFELIQPHIAVAGETTLSEKVRVERVDPDLL